MCHDFGAFKNPLKYIYRNMFLCLPRSPDFNGPISVFDTSEEHVFLSTAHFTFHNLHDTGLQEKYHGMCCCRHVDFCVNDECRFLCCSCGSGLYNTEKCLQKKVDTQLHFPAVPQHAPNYQTIVFSLNKRTVNLVLV